MRVQNGIVLTMEGAPIPCGYIDFADGIITGCGHMENAPPTLVRCWMPRVVIFCPALLMPIRTSVFQKKACAGRVKIVTRLPAR